jgi:MFS family permease
MDRRTSVNGTMLVPSIERIAMLARRPFFYGWMIVAIAVASMLFIYGAKNSFAVFFASLLRDYHWSRGSTAIMYSLHNLLYGLLAPVAGSLTDRWKPKRVMVTGVIILSLSTGACALAFELWHFYLLFGLIMPIGTVFCGLPVLAPALTNWFVKKRGLVLGLGLMGGGMSFVFNLLAGLIIQRWGWRVAYLVLGGSLFVFVLPLYIFLFHYRPENINLKAYGALKVPTDKGLAPPPSGEREQRASEWPLKKIIKAYQLWLLIASYFLYWGVGCFLVLAHQVKFVEDIGFSNVFGASTIALLGVFIGVGQFSGFLSDRFGREKTITLAVTLSIVALSVLMTIRDTSHPWLLYVHAVCFGYGAGLYAPTILASAADIFHGRQFGVISGLLLTGLGVGGAIGPWIGGHIYDATGSYRPAFLLCIVCFAAAILFIWIAAPRHAVARREHPERWPGKSTI